MRRRSSFIVVLLAFAALGGCGELQDWRSTQRADTLEAYESFVARYPQSQYVPVAQRRLVDLVEQRDWLIATESDTAAGYRAFINTHPKGRWTRGRGSVCKTSWRLRVFSGLRRSNRQCPNLLQSKLPYSNLPSRLRRC